ncbi:MAG: VOC family protein [Pseudomonadota bacterium]
MTRISLISATALLALCSTEAQAEPPEGTAVTGFGGFFFRAEDPAALAEWYKGNLGIDKTPTSYDIEPWTQDAGYTVFAPFPSGSTEFAPEGKSFVLNFRTDDLDGLVEHLRAHEVEVTVDEQLYPNGRFASLSDPEGNPIQLWEPQDPDE